MIVGVDERVVLGDAFGLAEPGSTVEIGHDSRSEHANTLLTREKATVVFIQTEGHPRDASFS